MSLTTKRLSTKVDAVPETPATEHPCQITPSNAEIDAISRVFGVASPAYGKGNLSAWLSNIVLTVISERGGDEEMARAAQETKAAQGDEEKRQAILKGNKA